MARFCNQCNYPIEEGGNFCTECGSNNIRDDVEQPQQNTEETSVEETVQTETAAPESTATINSPIPEIETDAVRSFGEKSMEQAQSSTIKPINNSQTDDTNNTTSTASIETPPTPVVEVPQAVQNEPANSFADVPDFMNGTQQVNVPNDFQLQEGSANDYQQTKLTPGNNTGNTQKRKTGKKKKDKTVLTVILSVGGVLAILFLFVVVYSYGKANGNPFTNGDISSSGNPGNIDYSTIFTAENSFRVGDPKVGYVSIPKTWAQVAQPSGSTALQYTDGTTWVVTLMASPTSQYSAVTYANNVYNSIKTGGGQNITTGKTTIAGYPALTITASYPTLNKYLTTWCFESKIGQTHYLAIEGPSPSGDNYNVIYSFKEDK